MDCYNSTCRNISADQYTCDNCYIPKYCSEQCKEKDVKAHPGMKVPPAIQETAIYNAQYILETKSKSPFSKNLKKGDQLKFFSSTS